MADADAAPPTAPPEAVAPEEHPPAAADSTVAAPEAEVDNKRKKVEEVSADDVEANGTGADDAKRPRVDDGEPDAAKAVEHHKDDGSSVNMEEPAVSPTTDGAAAMDDDDGDNATPAPAPACSDEKKPLLEVEAAFDEAPQQEGDDAEAAAQDDDAIISRKIQVPTKMLPVLIGEGGETIKNLKKRSGAEIKITMDSSDTDSNALTCSAQLVASSLASVDKAELLIKRVIAEAEAWGRFRTSDEQLPLPAAEPEPEPFEMTVPANKVGLIIGRQGQTIRDLQSRSGAKIGLRPEGRILVSGNEKQTEAAKDLIKQVLDQTFSNQLSGSGYGPQGYRRCQCHGAGSWWGRYYSHKFFKQHFQNHGAAALAPDSASDDKLLLEAAAEAPQQEAGDAATDAQNISRMIQVPNSKVHVLIGKAGETLRNLHLSSGAKIQIPRDGEVDPNAPTRPVELIGSLGSVDKAEQLIKTIAEAEAEDSQGEDRRQPDGVEQFEMSVPNNQVGLIIGKGGETIKGMQDKSGACIQLIPLHLPEGVTLTERIVRVTGYKKQTEVAKELIKQALNQTFSNQSELCISKHVSDSELETARLRREAVLLESYTKLMTMDTTEMTDEMKDEHTKGLKMLRAKIAGNTE